MSGVLATMNFACEVICEHSPAGVRSDAATKLAEASATVAELITAAQEFLDTPTAFDADWDAYARLAAAIAKATGADA